MAKKFNIIIPAAYKDFEFLKKTIKYVSMNIKPQKIYLIIDTRLIKFLPKKVKCNAFVEVLDENYII